MSGLESPKVLMETTNNLLSPGQSPMLGWGFIPLVISSDFGKHKATSSTVNYSIISCFAEPEPLTLRKPCILKWHGLAHFCQSQRSVTVAAMIALTLEQDYLSCCLPSPWGDALVDPESTRWWRLSISLQDKHDKSVMGRGKYQTPEHWACGLSPHCHLHSKSFCFQWV